MPVGLPAQRMGGVGRREAADMHQSARHQPVERGVLRGRCEQRVERLRHGADQLVELRLRPAQPRRKTIRHAGAHGETAVHAAGIGRAKLALQLADDRVAMRHAGKRQRHEAARPKLYPGIKPAILQRDLGIAAEAEGAHRDRLDHRAEAADGRAFRIKPRAAIVEHRDVCRRAADIRHDGIVEPGHVARADKAGGRARQNGLDRPGAGKAGGNQRTVAPHDHQRGRDAARLQKALGRGDQAVDHRDEAGVEKRRQRAARTAELGGKLMARRDRQAGLLADQVARRDLMRRVAHREIGADRETGDGCAELRQGRLQRLQMQRMRIAMHIVAARRRRSPDRCRAPP